MFGYFWRCFHFCNCIETRKKKVSHQIKPWETQNSEKTFLCGKIALYKTNVVSFSQFTHSVLTMTFHSTELSLNNWLCHFPQLRWELRRLLRKIGPAELSWDYENKDKEHNSTSILGLKKVTEILFLESLTFDLSDSCNLSSLRMCLWASAATFKLRLESCIISPSSQLPLC